MAIGRPVSLTSNVASKTISVTATASQTLFTVTGGYRINQVAVFRNGVRLADGSDYTVADAIVSANAEQTINGNLTVTGSITGVTSVTGAMVGIQSAGTLVGAAKTLNFVGTGNTFAVNGDTIDISISGGGGGGGLGTAINYTDGTTSPFSYIDRSTEVTENLLLDTTKAGEAESIIVSVIPNIEINSGIAVTVGAGKTMIIDVLQIGDL
jgi:hypothetical protein